MSFALHRIAVACALASVTLAPELFASVQVPSHAMSDRDSTKRATGSIRAQAVGFVTRVDPAFDGRAYTEGYVAQPIIMAHGSALGGHIAGVLTLNFEGLTLERGQLTPGAYGEGYVDRRHPHTYLHEAVVTVRGRISGIGVSAAGGKGFVPFGTDDPMMRPFVAYPVNHHLAQILERYIAVVALNRGPVTVEGGVFNGDEPLSAGAPPDAGRFGDSWSVRGTVAARPDVELQGSFASVTSPELAAGGGLDQRKWSLAARLERSEGLFRSGLIEWAQTQELVGDFRTNRFSSFLSEASFSVRRAVVSGRFESTTRPESERLLDPFRTARSPTDLSILGITRWNIGTIAASVPTRVRRLELAPFAELAYSHATEEITPSAFVPRDFYGSSSLWTVSLGARVGFGHMPHRMGRYGVATSEIAPRSKTPDSHVH